MKYKLVFLLLFFVLCCADNFYEKVTTKVEYVRCKTGSIGAISLVKVLYNEKVYNVSINKSSCRGVKIGDTMSMLYSKKSDRMVKKDN